MLALLVAAAVATAAPAGHYHPDDVAVASARFREGAEVLGPGFDRVQQQLTQRGAALEVLDQGVLLLGDRAPDALSVWAEDTRKRTTAWYLQVQRHVDLLQQDFGDEFGGALARALQAQTGEVVECGNTGLSAIMGAKKQCPGDDRNATLAAAIDADAELKAFVAEIAEVPWPESTVEPRAWAPVPLTGSARYVRIGALLDRFAEGALERRADALDDTLQPLEEGLEAGDPAAVAEGQAARGRYAQALAADGEVLWAAMESTLAKAEKRGGPADVGVCAVPAALGGCDGEDATEAVLAALADDKRFGKAISGLR